MADNGMYVCGKQGLCVADNVCGKQGLCVADNGMYVCGKQKLCVAVAEVSWVWKAGIVCG